MKDSPLTAWLVHGTNACTSKCPQHPTSSAPRGLSQSENLLSYKARFSRPTPLLPCKTGKVMKWQERVIRKLPHSRKQLFRLYLRSCSFWIDALSAHPSQEWHQIKKPDMHRHTHSLEMPQLLNEWSWDSTKADTMKLWISLHTLTSLFNISLGHKLTYQLMWSEHIY